MADIAKSGANHRPKPDGAIAGSPQQADLISKLFRDNNQALLNFLLTQLSNEQEAREVAQEAYVKLLQLDKPDSISFLRTYLFRIAMNLAIDRAPQHAQRAHRPGGSPVGRP